MRRLTLSGLTVLIALACGGSPARSQTPVPNVRAVWVELMGSWYGGDVQQLEALLMRLEGLLEKAPDDAGKSHCHYYTGLAYRQKSALLSQQRDDLLTAAKHFEAAIELNSEFAEAHAFLANVYRMLIGSGNPDPAWFHRTREHREAALSIAPNNPAVLMLEASALIFIPENRGGDIEQGLETAFEAAGRFELGPQTPETEWARVHTWALIGTAYQREGRPREALSAFKKTLELEKNWSHIKNTVVPELRRQTEQLEKSEKSK